MHPCIIEKYPSHDPAMDDICPRGKKRLINPVVCYGAGRFRERYHVHSEYKNVEKKDDTKNNYTNILACGWQWQGKPNGDVAELNSEHLLYPDWCKGCKEAALKHLESR